MRKQRSFSTEFKRQVVEEYLSGVSTAAQLCRRHSISSGLLYYWKKQYVKNSFEADSAKEAALEERIKELEQALGQSRLENEFLKKLCIGPSSRPGKKGVHCRPPRLCRNRHKGVRTHEPPSKQLLLKPKPRELSPEDRDLEKRITEEFPKYGYRKVTRQLHGKAIR